MKTIVDVLKFKIDNFRILGVDHSSLLSIYGNLLFTMDSKELNKSLLYLKEQYENDETSKKDVWFYDFHKSIRQCNFFTDIEGYRIVNNLTDEQKTLRESLLNKSSILYKNWNKENPNASNTEYHKWRESDVEKIEIIKQLRPLNSLANTKEDIGLIGTFDSILWNIIHLDENNILKMILEQTFNEYDIYTANIKKTERIVQQ